MTAKQKVIEDKCDRLEPAKKLRNVLRVGRRLPFFYVCITTIFLNGCISLQTLNYKPQENDGSVYLFRKSSFNAGGGTAVIQVNGDNIVKLRTREFTVIRLPEGQHEIGVQCEGTAQRDTKTVNTHENTKLYYEVKPNPDRVFWAATSAIIDALAVPTFLLEESSQAQFSLIQAVYKEEKVKYLP